MPPRARALQGRRAGVVTRAIANAVDLVVVLTGLLGAYAAVGAVRYLVDPVAFHLRVPDTGISVLLGLGLQIGYFTASWTTTGRTIGDRLLGLRVVNARGKRLRPVGAFVRGVLCALFPLGLLWAAVSRRNASVQDLILRTSVIYDWKLHTPPLEERRATVPG